MDWRKFFRIALAVVGGCAFAVLLLTMLNPNILGQIKDDVLEAVILGFAAQLPVLLALATFVLIGIHAYEHKGNRGHMMLWSLFIASMVAAFANIIAHGELASWLNLAWAVVPAAALWAPRQAVRNLSA